ncbi:MAG TPA: Gfo/Idh/MocA family oxidoreductase [Phycicoccus elongatus]|jgi:predicted dehydrogenase|nr:Gfo/Idh/MocA family oxidoreductase [Phycicoccus elongatus]
MQGLIIGFGYIAEGHLQGYQETLDLEVVAVVDVSAQRRERALRRGLRAFSTVDEALGSVGVDFVDVCTPPSLHLAGIRSAIAAGLPVLCEKPVFVPGDNSYDDVLEHVWAGGSLVYPCQNYKYAPVFTKVRQIIGSGALGTIQRARVDIARRSHARGVVEWNPDWRRDQSYSAGGILRDHGPHAIYLLLSLLGQQPRDVSVVTGSLARSQPNGGTVEDTALLRLRCDEGAECDVSLTWAAGHRSSRYLFAGTAGFVSVENDTLTWSEHGQLFRESVHSDFDDPSHSAWFAAMFEDFSRLVRSGSAGLAHGQELVTESLHTTAVIDAGYVSARAAGAWTGVADLRPQRSPWPAHDLERSTYYQPRRNTFSS